MYLYIEKEEKTKNYFPFSFIFFLLIYFLFLLFTIKWKHLKDLMGSQHKYVQLFNTLFYSIDTFLFNRWF